MALRLSVLDQSPIAKGRTPADAVGEAAEDAAFEDTWRWLMMRVQALLAQLPADPNARLQDGAGYGYANPVRRAGASEAARRGAVAYLHRSLSTDDTRLPHAGAMNYQADAPKIPAAALSTPDAELIAAGAQHSK